MKLSCQIVQDLLPLYEDSVCSDESRAVVQAHLCECEQCRALCSKPLPKFISEETVQEETAVKQGLRKIRRRWRLSFFAIAMILPIVLLGLLSYHEYKGEGICFSNLNELWSCSRFLDALEDGDGERAASYLDFSALYREYREAIEMTPEDFMPTYVEVKIGGETWMAYDWYAQEYLTGGSASDIWENLIYSNQDSALIPLDVWNELMPNEAQGLQGQGYRLPNGTCYFPYETQWGSFMLIDSTWDALQSDAKLEITDFVAMLPKEMYLEIRPVLEANANENYDAVQERMKEFADMNEVAFQNYMREKYAQKMETIEFVAVTDSGYYDAFMSEDVWNITFKVELIYDGVPVRSYFRFHARDGMIIYLDATPDSRFEEENVLYHALYSIFSLHD